MESIHAKVETRQISDDFDVKSSPPSGISPPIRTKVGKNTPSGS
jgi:hypothetical protein